MKSINVGIFHDECIGPEMGKKGTESDIAMFNRKTDDCTFTFMQPVGGKLVPKSQIMSAIDAAVISLADMTPEVGETILMLDSFRISKGVAVLPPFTDVGRIAKITCGTALETFVIKERDPRKVLDVLEKLEPCRDDRPPAQVVIDHSFSVRGVGEVVLGFVRKGVVRKHDELILLPADRKVTVRSIQMNDKDVDEAGAGSRVGLAIKGAAVDEMRRGTVICAPGGCLTASKIKLHFERSRFYSEDFKDGAYHVTVGMQTVPVNVSGMTDSSLTIESEKPLVYSPGDVFLILNLNAKKLHMVGTGKAI